MADDTERLGLLMGVFELALGRLFEASLGGGQARDLFVEDVRRLLSDTREVQSDSPAVQTYEALLRRLGATRPGDADGLGVIPAPEQGAPPVGSGV